jgi:molybdopterin-guanine dinucleotide biosynthesis protein A
MAEESNGLGPHVGVILAGGSGSRMGVADKPLVRIGGRTMLARVMERFAPQVDRLILNANGDAARFSEFGVAVVPDLVPGLAGPLAGLHAGMRWAEENLPQARFVATVAADMPFIPLDFVAQLSEGCGRDENTVALAASSAGTHPVCGLWPVKLADGLEKLLVSGESTKVLSFADRFMRLNVPFDDIVLPSGERVDPFFNVNTPEEAQRAGEIAAALEGNSTAAGAPS